MLRLFRVMVLAAMASSAGAVPGAAPGAVPGAASTPVDERDVHEVAAQLRCVVCQNLSVADSPSEMANQMRGIIRERLAQGERPEQIVQYFVDKYGEWILLTPRRQGFNLVVWLMPGLAVLAGLAAVAFRVRRWTRARSPAPAEGIDPAVRERIRREMESAP